MKNILRIATASATLFTPLFVAAQINTGGAQGEISTLLVTLDTILDSIIPFLIALAVLFFIWGLLKFMFSAGNEDAKDSGRRIMIWGIIILFVMVSIWGLVGILTQFTGVSPATGAPGVPPTPAPVPGG